MNEQDDRQDQHKVRPEQIRIEVYMHGAGEDRILSKLGEILNVVKRQGVSMALDLSELQSKVEANSTVSDSAVVLLKGLKDKLDAAISSGDPAALKALSDALGADTQELADAISTNTPAESV